jgi:hypothetical protein
VKAAAERHDAVAVAEALAPGVAAGVDSRAVERRADLARGDDAGVDELGGGLAAQRLVGDLPAHLARVVGAAGVGARVEQYVALGAGAAEEQQRGREGAYHAGHSYFNDTLIFEYYSRSIYQELEPGGATIAPPRGLDVAPHQIGRYAAGCNLRSRRKTAAEADCGLPSGGAVYAGTIGLTHECPGLAL